MLFCTKCGTQLPEDSLFCSQCGARTAAVAPVTPVAPAAPVTPAAPSVAPPVGAAVERLPATGDVSPKSRLAASLLAFFVGGFGAHRFYMGKIGTAVVMLLLGAGFVASQIGATYVAVAEADAVDPPPLFLLFLGISVLFGAVVGIWALIDFIVAVSGNFKDNQGRPVQKW